MGKIWSKEINYKTNNKPRHNYQSFIWVLRKEIRRLESQRLNISSEYREQTYIICVEILCDLVGFLVVLRDSRLAGMWVTWEFCYIRRARVVVYHEPFLHLPAQTKSIGGFPAVDNQSRLPTTSFWQKPPPQISNRTDIATNKPLTAMPSPYLPEASPGTPLFLLELGEVLTVPTIIQLVVIDPLVMPITKPPEMKE